jgi:hypothetical protein
MSFLLRRHRFVRFVDLMFRFVCSSDWPELTHVSSFSLQARTQVRALGLFRLPCAGPMDYKSLSAPFEAEKVSC